jgi:predicted nucleic acid-binding protein
MTRPLDTNVILRHVTRDHADHSRRAHQLMQELESGVATARLTEGVLVEAVQVLSSKVTYHLPRTDIRTYLANVITMPGVELPDKRRYLRALDRYVAIPALSFVDALLSVYAEDSPTKTVLSFDQEFDRVPSITRVEP